MSLLHLFRSPPSCSIQNSCILHQLLIITVISTPPFAHHFSSLLNHRQAIDLTFGSSRGYRLHVSLEMRFIKANPQISSTQPHGMDEGSTKPVYVAARLSRGVFHARGTTFPFLATLSGPYLQVACHWLAMYAPVIGWNGGSEGRNYPCAAGMLLSEGGFEHVA
jgi:hypothetical protein